MEVRRKKRHQLWYEELVICLFFPLNFVVVRIDSVAMCAGDPPGPEDQPQRQHLSQAV